MQRLTLFIFFALALCSAPTHAAFSQDPDLSWKTLHTPHFHIHFHDGEEPLAREVAVIAEQVHERLSKYFAWQPQRPTEVLLTDRMDFSNGASTPAPNNQMTLIVTPPDDINTLENFDDWLELLITHEYTHVLHLDKATGVPGQMRHVFGRWFPWLFPNILQPPWIMEGLATYVETDRQHHIGRGQSSTFEMLMRMEVAHGLKPLRQVNQPVVTWPAGTTRYLYGVYFFQFIEERYGAQRLQDWIANYSNNLIPFMLNTNSSAIFGKPLDQLWAEFEGYLQQKFEKQIAAIRAQGLRIGTQVSHSGYYTSRPRVMPNGDLYYMEENFQNHARLMVVKAGEKEARVFTPVHDTRFDLHPRAGVLLAELGTINNVNYFSDLYRVDLTSLKKTRLTQGARYRYGLWSPDGRRIVAVHNELGNSSLHLLNSTGVFMQVLWQGTHKEVIGELTWSPDGTTLVAALWRPETRWEMEQFDLTTKTWTRLTHSTDVEAHPRFTNDSRSIIYTSDQGGVFNLRRMNLASGAVSTLTNVLGGAFNPALSPDEKTLYYTGAGEQGFDIFRLELGEAPADSAPPTEQKKEEIAPPKPARVIVSEHSVSEYSPLDSLSPKWWAPYLQITDARTELGVVTGGSDALGRHNFLVAAAYDTKNRWPLGLVQYFYDRWDIALKLSASREALEYLDSYDEVARFRHSDTLLAEAVWPFLGRDAQWALHAGIVYEHEQDALVNPPHPRLSSVTDAVAGLAVTYNSAHRYPLSVSLSNGRQVSAALEQSDLFQSDYSGYLYSVDWREFLHLSHQQVLALRFAGGYGKTGAKPFRLGGSMSEGVAHPLDRLTDDLLHKRRFSLRGYPEGLRELRGYQMLLGSIDWRFPIYRPEHGYMAPPIGVHQWHGTVFVNAGNMWETAFPSKRPRVGAGLEINTEFVLGYWVVVNARLGYARGFQSGGEHQAYLTVGSSF